MTEKELQEFGKRIMNFCNKYYIPCDFLFEILEDQKVIPMIRGKAMEYNAFLLLDKILPKSVWSVQKLNLNPQPGVYDEDTSVTHRRKCHRSRSNIKLVETSNDRYALGCFDIILTTPLNAIYEGNTIGETLEIINDIKLKEILYKHYSVNRDEELIKACSTDWRYCIPEDIAENGFIPRTPYVKLTNDPHWKPIIEIEKGLTEVVKLRRDSQTRRN